LIHIESRIVAADIDHELALVTPTASSSRSEGAGSGWNQLRTCGALAR
jgi:hypothetical protein